MKEVALIIRAARSLTIGGGIALIAVLALGGCKMKQNDPRQDAQARADAKRQQGACGSATAYERVKDLLFDQAIGGSQGDRANLDTLADYSTARMEQPVVKGWDPSLDIITCKGRFILEIPPGAERGLGGEHRLQADIDYSAQAAADGSGFVYQVKGAEPIVARLAAFNLASAAYRPPPAIDEGQGGAQPSAPTAMASADVPQLMPAPAPRTAPPPAPAARQAPQPPARPPSTAPARVAERAVPEPSTPASSAGGSGEATVRAFYGALGAGNGAAASAQIVPEKRSSRAFSPEAITRFYGRLAEPVRVTSISPLPGGRYRVSYRYSAGRSHCNGSAVVSLTNRGGRDLIRSVRALNGC